MCRMIVWYALIVVLCNLAFASENSPAIKKVNSTVSAINDSIKSGYYPFLEIGETSTSEGSPAELQIYFEGERIILVNVEVGHETWLIEYSYYYYPNGKPMKCLEVIKDRPDNPPRKAIIYNESGNPVWKNTDLPDVSPQELYNLFKNIQKVRMGLSH